MVVFPAFEGNPDPYKNDQKCLPLAEIVSDRWDDVPIPRPCRRFGTLEPVANVHNIAKNISIYEHNFY